MNAPGLCRLIAILLPALATFLSQVALAGNIVDPKPSMRPEEMARAELVVLAQYEKHEGASLGLKVLEVLRGKLVKPGDVITVALEHWYSVETGPTGIELLMKSNPKADNVPTLCYKQQIDNPGDVVPIPILPKPTDAALYFFPSEAAPALSAWGQMQPASTAEGWRDILAGRKPGILFRLLETPDQQAAREAVEELARTRDPPAIARLVNLAATPQSRYRSEQSLQSQARNLDPVTILAVIGDQKGDVYDPLLAKIKALPERTLLEQMTAPIPDLHLVLAKVDPDRALRDFSRVVSEGNREEKSAAVRWIAEIKTEASANYLVDLLKQPDLEAQAAKAILLTVKPEVGAHWLFGWEHSHNEEARINRIRLLVQTRVAALANSPDLAELACARLRDLLASLGEPKAPDNMARDEELLRRPETYSSETAASSKGGKLLQAITRRPEPRWVPLLLKMWKEIPAAREYDSSIFRDALLAHASLFPNATRRQLAALGVDDEIRKLGETDHRTTINEVYAADGNPLTLDQVRLVWSHAAFRGRGLTLDPVSYSSEEMAAWRAAWFRSHPLPAELVEKLKGAVEGKIASTRIFGGVVARSDDLQVLCDSDPKAADQILDKYLPDRGKRNNYVRFPLLHTAVQRGRLEFADELLALTRTMAFRADQPCLVLAMLVQRGRKDLAPELIK
ncbi:MAG: hypothetical protein NT049_09980, partial [Planctomycetota bacterium]|nr:hypothetical protein [Planctomycetota bacterium]